MGEGRNSKENNEDRNTEERNGLVTSVIQAQGEE
jgi:hypothetical protein